LSSAVDLAPSWKPEHLVDEEQKGVQYTMQIKAEEIASRQQPLMDWLIPLYATKVSAVEQESPAAMTSSSADEPNSCGGQTNG
jgi:hypothetical protein